MEYNRTYWQAREGTKLNKFQKVNETTSTVELVNAPDSITVDGTEVTTDRLNNMESGITGAVAGVNEIQGVVDFTTVRGFFALGQTSRRWRGMTTRGNDVYACVDNDDIYKQTGGVGDFIALGQTSRLWRGMTTLGNDIYACVTNGDIYKQTGGVGDFIALGQTSRRWYGMTTLGNDIYACVTNGDIYKQTGGVGGFIALGQATRFWRAMTTLGNDIYACVENGDIYKQTGGVGGFIALGQATRFWCGMTTLGDDVYACVVNGDIYKQTNGTGNFIALGQESRGWCGMTTLGSDVYACVNTGDIYKQTVLTGNTFRASSSFTLPAMPDGARKRILNTHATTAITVTAYSGTTIEGQATMTLSAGHEVELELIGTDWRKVVLSQSSTPEAGKAMVWPSESSPGSPWGVPTIYMPDALRASVEAATGGAQTVLYDVAGNPSYMHVIPRFNVEDIHADLGVGVHPAFKNGGVDVPYLFIGSVQAVNVGGKACSIPGRDPWASINFDDARAACVAKGAGWHLMSNWEWAAIALWCLKNGFQPRGNTNYGRAHDALHETASRYAGTGRTKGGSGPASWRHNGELAGIADLVGNVWEWQDGLKLVDGQIVMPNDNQFALAEASWPAQGVFFDSTGTTGTTTTGGANGAPVLSAARNTPSNNCGNGLGASAPDSDYTTIGGESGWRSMTQNASFNALALATRQKMVQALVSSKVTGAGSEIFSAKGYVGARNYGERFPLRGGNWAIASSAGIGALNLDYRRSHVSDNIGFRPAFIGN